MKPVAVLFWLLSVSATITDRCLAAATGPNFIFILADDLGAHDPGCFGSTYHQTPNINRLAARGVKLTEAYAASPLCSPTRSSILTGQYPARIGITSPACHLPRVQLEKQLAAGNANTKVLNADRLTRLKSGYFTLAEALREAGYATAHFGNWHLGHNLPQNPDDHYEPNDQGFDLDFPHVPTSVVTFRVRGKLGGAGKVEWLRPAADGKTGSARSVPFTVEPGEWQSVSVAIPEQGPLGIVRLYLPAQQQAVELDWVELKGAGSVRRWDF